MNQLVIAIFLLSASLWGWLAVKVIDQGRKVVELEARINAQESRCTERYNWMHNMDKKLERVADDTLAIRVKLGCPAHEE